MPRNEMACHSRGSGNPQPQAVLRNLNPNATLKSFLAKRCLMGVLIALLAFFTIVTIHELGHSFFSLLFGIKIKRFGFGLPISPITLNVSLPENKYFEKLSFSPLLFIAFVEMDIDKVKALPVWKKSLIYSGGIIGNLILCSTLLIFMGAPVGTAIIQPLFITLTFAPFLIYLAYLAATGQTIPKGNPPPGMPDSNFIGPVGIVHHLSGVNNIIWWTMFLSLMLACMNAIPLPPLDGGKIVCAWLEKIIGKERAERLDANLSIVFGLLLLALMIIITFFDVRRLF